MIFSNHLSNYTLSKSDKITFYTVYNGKKGDPQARFEYSPYNRKWMFERKGSMWGFVPVSKQNILDAFDNDFRGRGDSGKYQEALLYKNGKLIGVISNYEYPEALGKKRTTKRK